MLNCPSGTQEFPGLSIADRRKSGHRGKEKTREYRGIFVIYGKAMPSFPRYYFSTLNSSYSLNLAFAGTEDRNSTKLKDESFGAFSGGPVDA